MKKIFAFILVLVLSLSLSACIILSESDPQTPSSVIPGSNVSKATISETVLFDQSGVKITAKSLETNGFLGPEIKLLIENNSGKDLTFQCRNVSVNGYMVDPMLSVDVVNGKKANDAISFMSSELEACGIETIADVELSFHIFTTSEWETYLDTPQIQIKTSAAETYQYTFDDSGTLAYEGHGTKIIIKGLDTNGSILGPEIIVYIENNGNQPICVQTQGVSINGYMVDAFFSPEVMPGKHAVSSITFLSSDLQNNGITKIESVELSFHIFNNDTWDTIVDTNTVNINF